MHYKGKYPVKNPSKYDGDPTEVVFRSMWERNTFRFLDESSQVARWSSENTVIPYICGTDKRPHRYFVDLKVTFTNGKTYLIEIKPEKETKAPRKSKNQKRYITEVMTYVKNQAKWKYAEEYASKRGWEFVVWTEKTLAGFGIKLIK